MQKSHQAMLRRTIIIRIGAYSRFMRETKNHPKLKGLSIPARGKALAKLYHELSPAEAEALKARANATSAPRRVQKPPVTRMPTDYNLFVRRHITAPLREKAHGRAPRSHP
ncbi:kinetoplast DNA-associated protein, putative [Bodo saltans]|uniref:Kinetoplast DNA-associated protein, putative n=1 Tax=Bodo saltans TaxID=75058 RepID=A0A0S4JT41_BODSA|nr:kinetoplast DNA-associated protein, putative [Bodo saltans]|eukprot:CUG93536.1 kinetoplast DNA-associated protein, putative [Bodo saltans]